jgi:hypothetical protein
MARYCWFSKLLGYPLNKLRIFLDQSFCPNSISSVFFIVPPLLVKGLYPDCFPCAFCIVPPRLVHGLASILSYAHSVLYLSTLFRICAPICSHALCLPALFKVCAPILSHPRFLLCLPAFFQHILVVVDFWCNVGSLLNSLQLR